MSARYLLPCPCGLKTPVEVAQSGQTIACECGRPLDIPTMLEIRKLDRVPAQPSQSLGPGWGIRQQLLTVGALIATIAAMSGVLLTLVRPQPPQPPDMRLIEARLDRMTVLGTFNEWEQLNKGVQQGPPEIWKYFKSQVDGFYRWCFVIVVLGLLGVGCAVSSVFVAPAGGNAPSQRR